ncbi:MAG TPA: VanW family protein, partial [Chloroflexota bacterium]
AQALLARPVVLRAEEVSREIAPADLADALDVTATPGGGATLVLKEAVLRQLVETFARAVDRAPVDASVAIAEGPEVVVSEDVAGRRVDVESTAAALRSALLNGSHGPVTATIETLPPRVTRSDVAPIAARIERMIGSPLTLEAQGKRLALDPSSLAELVVVDAPEGEVPSVGVDRAAVEAVVERFAASVYRPPRDARFTLDGGKLQVSSPEEPGVRLDTATSIDLVAEALVSDRRVVQLPVATIQPKITRATIAELNDAKVVGEASTPMRGVPEKLHNIRLAASRLDGVVVPPGEVFSFNSSLGPTTLESGFKTAWGILTTKDGLRTVPSVAGGICQVATTLFQAAFWAGYPIEQRYHHSYWIPSYASRGYVGLDATVDADYGLDFKFSNPTEHPILIRAAATGDRLTFSLYSVDPGWQVEVQKPIVTNVVPADKKVYEEPDPNMPQGQRLWIEAAHDGFTSTIVRIVRSAEGEQTTKIVSHYAPARNVVRVGTKVVAPEQPTTAQPADGTETPEGSRQSSPGASAPASPSA